MQVLLIQIDGKLPNIALMRIASHHHALGDTCMFKIMRRVRDVQPVMPAPDLVYSSGIFMSSLPLMASQQLPNQTDPTGSHYV